MERLVILGGGESGAGAAKLGKKLGYEVFLSDKGKLGRCGINRPGNSYF